MMEKNFDVKEWGGYARCYDALNSLKPYDALIRAVRSRIDLSPGQCILDAACGTGNLEWRIKKGGGFKGSHVTGIDFSAEMIGVAQAKCRTPGVTFMRADLNGPLEFRSGMFEQVVSVNTLYALSDPAAALKEFGRVLKPGGKMILVNPKKGFENGLVLKAHCGDTGPDDPWLGIHTSAERERELVSRAVKDPDILGPMLAVGQANRRIAATRVFHFLDPDVLTGLVRAAGFRILETAKVYADQGILVRAEKGGIHEIHSVT